MKELIAYLSLTFLLTGCWETEKGEKIGTIVKLNQQGVFVKTHEAELIRGGMTNGSGNFGKPFDFTIEDGRMYEVANDALSTQRTVKITYHKELFTLLRTQTHDNSFLDSIEIIS